MRKRPSFLLSLFAIAALTASLVVAPSSLAQEEAANNLSVPAIFVPSTAGAPPLSFACGAAVPPSGTTTLFTAPLSPAPPGEYYLQGANKWQAQCAIGAQGLDVRAEWGDNLTNAPLKAGTPIRVEMGLLLPTTPTPPAMAGYTVYKLTNELDRYATYGTPAVGGAIAASPEVRVWSAGAGLKIYRSDGLKVYDGPFSAEINSTGRVVFGYNWQKPLPGTYVITFTAPNVDIVDKDAGTLLPPSGVQLQVVVNTGSGRGGGNGGGGGGGGGGNGGGGGAGGPRGPR